MLANRVLRKAAFASAVLALLAFCSALTHAQVAILMEEPYGFFGNMSPNGHIAIYFARVCAETPLKLRRCQPGEFGAVITREPNISGYDWVAVPLVPYLYSVENPAEVPARVDRDFVHKMRRHYHEAHLLSLGEKLIEGNIIKGGWGLLVGQSYERRMYAFRFETTPQQDDALIERMNTAQNRSHFQYAFNNCADFTRAILNTYYPGSFHRSILPDGGISSPKQITHHLVRFARKHPEMQLKVFEISQIPGYRRQSQSAKTLVESLTTTGFAVPIVLLNPYLAGGLFVDYLVGSRYQMIPRDRPVLRPDNLMALKLPSPSALHPEDLGMAAAGTEKIRYSETDEVASFELSLTDSRKPEK